MWGFMWFWKRLVIFSHITNCRHALYHAAELRETKDDTAEVEIDDEIYLNPDKMMLIYS